MTRLACGANSPPSLPHEFLFDTIKPPTSVISAIKHRLKEASQPRGLICVKQLLLFKAPDSSSSQLIRQRQVAGGLQCNSKGIIARPRLNHACVEGVILALPNLKEIKRQDKIMEDYSEGGDKPARREANI